MMIAKVIVEAKKRGGLLKEFDQPKSKGNKTNP